MRFRRLNKLYADILGYFWLPCQLCGQMYGGHEWKDVGGESSRLDGRGICPDCTRAGKGEDANQMFIEGGVYIGEMLVGMETTEPCKVCLETAHKQAENTGSAVDLGCYSCPARDHFVRIQKKKEELKDFKAALEKCGYEIRPIQEEKL